MLVITFCSTFQVRSSPCRVYSENLPKFIQNQDFDDDKYSPTIDYSVSTTLEDVEQFCSNEVVHGIDLGDINNFLHKKWLSLARLGHPADALSICLAEISSAWLLNASIDTKFHIQFGPPKVRALCKNEVILTFDLEKIAFFNGESFDRYAPFPLSERVANLPYSEEPEEYSDWKISFIVEVSEEKEADGAIKRLKLNLSSESLLLKNHGTLDLHS